MIRAIVTDIEGTTTSVSFVYDVLFPYAREQMANFIRTHREDEIVRAQLALICNEAGKPLEEELAIAQLLTWMDEDKKITPLKTLQGLIWQHGYDQSHFKGHLYEDVPRNLRQWHQLGIQLYVYSSGSVQAQKLLFANTAWGDLTGLFSGYFDTRIGNKRERESYLHIIQNTGFAPDEILFLSDIEEELTAAKLAGIRTILLVRDGDKPAGQFAQVSSFDQIQLTA